MATAMDMHMVECHLMLLLLLLLLLCTLPPSLQPSLWPPPPLLISTALALALALIAQYHNNLTLVFSGTHRCSVQGLRSSP